MYMNTKSPHCTVYPGVPSSETPFKEGIYQRDDPHSWGFYTHTHRAISSNQRLCKISSSLIVWQLWAVYETLCRRCFLSSWPFFLFTLPYFPHLSLTASSDCQRGMCLIACVHAECCIWTFESKLAAFYNGDNIMSFGCRFAQLHFWFFSFVFCCIFMILFWVILFCR